MRRFFLIILVTFIITMPKLQKELPVDVNHALKTLKPYDKTVVLTYKKGILEKEKRRYYLVCEGDYCTKRDTAYAKEQAMIIQDSIGVPIYRVNDIKKANCILYIKNIY